MRPFLGVPGTPSMLEYVAALVGNPLVAWTAGAAGVVLATRATFARQALSRKAADLAQAQEKVADGLWEIKAGAEARQRAEAAMHAKSRFLATVSHEVRTPLNGVLGMAELLGATPLDAEQMAYVEAIQTSGRALTALIDEVLDLSRIEAGRLDLAAEPFDLVTLVEAVVELLGPRAQEKGLEIASFVAPDVPALLVGDAARLRQVLINLAGNAVKFTERGGVGMRVNRSTAGGLVFTVADTGPGVPADRRSAIFDEFEQAAAGSSRNQNGTGLGLSIARRLVRLMGGEITLSDRPGGGSVFAFEVHLPVAAVGTAADDRMVLRRLAGTHALIVARSPFQAPSLAQMLGAAGARVTIAETVVQALSHLSAGPCDLLIVDCALGEAEVDRLADAPAVRAIAQKVLLFSPFERRAFGQKMVGAFGGWLVKPVRARSLALRLDTEANPRPPVATSMPPSDPVPSGLRVLLAEDNAINTLVMLKMLDRIGAEVTHAADGAVALEAALAAMRGETRPFHTILMDISMPGLDGQEAARLIRRAEAGMGQTATRIVALTAYAFDDDRHACFEAGIDDFLTKPIDLATLRSVLLAPRDQRQDEADAPAEVETALQA